MPALQSLVLTDRATTPVDHTFVPVGEDASGVYALEESASTGVGRKRFTISARRVNGKHKVRCVLTVPTAQTETINGVDNPKVVRTGFAELSFTFDRASTTQERKDIVGMAQSALDAAETLTNDALIEMESIY